MAIANENIAKGKWTQIKGKVKELWGDLKDDDLEKTKGDMSMIAGLVQQKYGEAQEAVRQKLNSILKGIGETPSKEHQART